MSDTKNLVIVESPAKSKTIKKYLGSGFEVKASFGHVVDLPKKNMGIEIENKFQPQYQVSPDKKKVISELKKSSKGTKVRIATDEDREGEAIGRHVANQLGLDIEKTPRIVFHEITKTAIQKAIKNPRTLDMKLVDAQQARRVLDRLVGFELSPVLWRKIKTGLSAGRVQSVAVRLIVEREREINKFEASSDFKIIGEFVQSEGKTFEAELNKKLKDEVKTQKFLESLKDAKYKISKIETKPGKKSPSAPFTTSTLQQEASRKLGYSVAQTMQLAQKLYESGNITYMRTDSVNISDDAIKSAKAYICSNYGEEYSKSTKYKSKSKGAQEAHECIRPTNISKPIAGEDARQKKLYDLIWKRSIASQMAPAEIEKTKATIDISNNKNTFVATGEVIKFDGFLKVYIESTDNEDEEEQKGMLPKLKENEVLGNNYVQAKEVFKKHPPRYTEASLVKKMEEQGIGRPSTYAPTISTIQKRGYITKETRQGVQRDYKILTLKKNDIKVQTKQQTTGTEKNKLFPTDIGMVVNDYLIENFKDILDYNFTASVEEQFDDVALGKIKWYKMISDFYHPFHKEVEDAIGKEGFVNAERELGTHPKTKEPVIAKMGRYGPMIQIGEKTENKKPRYAKIPGDKSIETITLDEALECFALPRVVGQYKDKDIVAGIGRFGPYLRYDKIFVSIPKDERNLDPKTISLDISKELVEKKLELERNKHINTFDHKGKNVEVLNGRYGPYIKYDGKNFKLSKEQREDPKKLKLEDCLKIIKEKK